MIKGQKYLRNILKIHSRQWKCSQQSTKFSSIWLLIYYTQESLCSTIADLKSVMTQGYFSVVVFLFFRSRWISSQANSSLNWLLQEHSTNMLRVQFSISAILSEPPAVPELHGPDGLWSNQMEFIMTWCSHPLLLKENMTAHPCAHKQQKSCLWCYTVMSFYARHIVDERKKKKSNVSFNFLKGLC